MQNHQYNNIVISSIDLRLSVSGDLIFFSSFLEMDSKMSLEC